MAKALIIKAKLRENKKPNALRATGFIPATIYGHGFESKSIQINAKDFSTIPHKAYSHINELDIEGEEKYPILIRNVQVDPVRDNFLNVEFYRIKSDEKIRVKVPINYVGHSVAVVAGGVLIISYNEIDIQCLPKDIPDTIEVNLEQITEIGQTIQVRDLRVSENIQILAKPDEVIAKVEVAKTHEVEEKAPVVEGAAAVPAEGTAAAPAEGAAPVTGKEVSGKQPATTKQAGAPGGKAPESKPAKK